MDHYTYIAKLLLEVPDRIHLLKHISDAQYGLLITLDQPNTIIEHNCGEVQKVIKELGPIVDQWKATNLDSKLLNKIENNLDEDFEELERHYRIDQVGEGYELWEPLFNKEAFKENILIQNEENVPKFDMEEGWGPEAEFSEDEMEVEPGPTHGNRNLEHIEYHRYRTISRSNPQVVVTFRCFWTGGLGPEIENLETVMGAPRVLKKYIRGLSKRARNQLLKRNPVLEMYRPSSDKK